MTAVRFRDSAVIWSVNLRLGEDESRVTDHGNPMEVPHEASFEPILGLPAIMLALGRLEEPSAREAPHHGTLVA